MKMISPAATLLCLSLSLSGLESQAATQLQIVTGGWCWAGNMYDVPLFNSSVNANNGYITGVSLYYEA
ncbi:MAG TPA: hypothetical protein VF815_00930 [Myxococcaceae bacterium]|jgi:hypothetical protein